MLDKIFQAIDDFLAPRFTVLVLRLIPSYHMRMETEVTHALSKARYAEEYSARLMKDVSRLDKANEHLMTRMVAAGTELTKLRREKEIAAKAYELDLKEVKKLQIIYSKTMRHPGYDKKYAAAYMAAKKKFNNRWSGFNPE